MKDDQQKLKDDNNKLLKSVDEGKQRERDLKEEVQVR